MPIHDMQLRCPVAPTTAPIHSDRLTSHQVYSLYGL